MSHSGEGSPAVEPRPRRRDQTHEYVVAQVRDVDLGTKIVFTRDEGVDTGWRQVFPVTYDIPLARPEAVHTAEDDETPSDL